ncbi:MAG: XkdF-like putative serine protease domain-containing protein [Bacteroidaceae bacterium]
MGTQQDNQSKKVLKFATPEQAAQASIDPSKEYKRIIYSEVYAPNRPDTDNMFMTAEDIENMAHNFLASGKVTQVDLQHDNVLQEGCVVVESFIARAGDQTFNEGAWVVGIKIGNDDTWAKVLRGEINGFSVEALVFFEETDLHVPDGQRVITGHTNIVEGHSHTFVVEFDEFGNVIGGQTDEVDGHRHLITSSTTTRFEYGSDLTKHRHLFASVDNLVASDP